jgi:hypothetical protein
MTKLSEFSIDGKVHRVEYVESQVVKQGVTCDIYTFADDASKDLAVVKVIKGHKTPLQKILGGTQTIEGYIDGKGFLNVTSKDGKTITYSYPDKNTPPSIEVNIGETMQWTAETDITFYEICTPPYKDGRFQNLPE